MTQPLDLEELLRAAPKEELKAILGRLGGPDALLEARGFDTIWVLREKLVQAAVSTPDRLRLGPVLPNWHWVVTAWSVEVRANAATSIRVGINSADEDYDLAEQVTAAANTLYHDTTVQVITHNEEFFAEFVGATAGDNLIVTAFGFQLPPGTPITPSLLLALAFPQRNL